MTRTPCHDEFYLTKEHVIQGLRGSNNAFEESLFFYIDCVGFFLLKVCLS